MTIPKVRVRRKTPKSKSGCATCRIRRIKCDETRPACQRCTSTKRLCDGYASDDLSSDQLVGVHFNVGGDTYSPWLHHTSSQKPWYLSLSKLSREEGEAFTFFRQHTAFQLQDGLKSQLWDRWAMQLSHQEPAILHAIVAVGAMHHARWDNPGDGAGSLQRVALTNYSKAVSELRDYMSRQPELGAVDTVLLACLLFVGFEMLQHEVSVAMEHLKLGLNIMISKHIRVKDSERAWNGPVIIKASPAALIDELVPIFVRLDYGAPMFGRRHPMLELAHDEYHLHHSLSIPSSFESVPQAKSYLDLLSSGIFRLRGELLDIAEKHVLDYGPSMSSDWTACYIQALSRSIDLGPRGYQILAQKQALEFGLAAFCRALDTLVASQDDSSDRATMAIQIQYVLVFFTITTCRDISEMICDGFQDLFKNAVDLAEEYITSALGYSESLGRRNLSFEPGVIPTIFLVASKCRQTAIRAKAIKLLDIGCRQEAMWDGRPFATIMQRLCDLETLQAASQCTIDRQHVSESENSRPEMLLHPEAARFCDVVIAEDFGRFGRCTLFCARYRHESDAQIEIIEHEIKFGESATGPFCTMKRGIAADVTPSISDIEPIHHIKPTQQEQIQVLSASTP